MAVTRLQGDPIKSEIRSPKLEIRNKFQTTKSQIPNGDTTRFDMWRRRLSFGV